MQRTGEYAVAELNGLCGIIMNKYNWNAKDYEKNSQTQQKWARELIEKLQLKGTENVLDLGCGDGKVTAEIARLVFNGSVIGVDNSTSMINLAMSKYPQNKYSNLSFKLMDARNLTFENQFDIIFSNAVLHWIKNHKLVIQGLYKSLKTFGKILLQMGGQGNANGILSLFNEIQLDTEWRPYFENFVFPYGFFGIAEYEQLLINSGFIKKRIELIPKDMKHNGKLELEGWIRTTWLPYIELVPEDKRDKFIRLISTKYIEKNPLDSDGMVHIAMVRLEVEAEKDT